MSSLPWDYRDVKSVARKKRKKSCIDAELADRVGEVLLCDNDKDEDLNDGVDKMCKVALCDDDKDEDLNDSVDRMCKLFSRLKVDDDKDEDLNDAVDTLCKGIMDYISCAMETDYPCSQGFIPSIKKEHRLNSRGNWSRCSRFLAFSQNYRSKFDKFIEGYSRVGIYPKKDMFSSARTFPINIVDVMETYTNFKRFDVVVDHSDHLFADSPIVQTSPFWDAAIRNEWRILEEGLPETIFVRAYESRMDLLRAVIIGAKGTPYHDGLFFFDVYFPRMYPLEPPLVRYHSFGFSINPHLFECGEVRKNLIRSRGPISDLLCPFDTTSMLQLLVSIQERVLNADPLFHEPEFVDSGPSVVAEYFSLLYNEDILLKSLKTMTYVINKPPKNFEAFIVGHFRNRALDILKACVAYRQGLAQAGRGVDYKESCCSMVFRKNVNLCMFDLLAGFVNNGAYSASGSIYPLFTPLSPQCYGSLSTYAPALNVADRGKKVVNDETASNGVGCRDKKSVNDDKAPNDVADGDIKSVNDDKAPNDVADGDIKSVNDDKAPNDVADGDIEVTLFDMLQSEILSTTYHESTGNQGPSSSGQPQNHLGPLRSNKPNASCRLRQSSNTCPTLRVFKHLCWR